MRKSATASVMRSINRAAVLDVIRQDGPIARSQLARRLAMSLPTVMRIVEDLASEDLVHLHDGRESTKGRPRSLVAFNGQAYAVVGLDLGGSKMFGTVADLAGHVEHEVYIQHEGDTADSLERLCRLIECLLAAPRPPGQRIRGIGVGAPGVTLSEQGIVTWAPSLGWRDLPLKAMLSERFQLPVFVENDVNLAALGELGFGAGRGAQNVVCIAVGTGIGAGVIIGGSLYRGHNQAAGEVGYLLPGIDYLGRRYDHFGALEGLASGSGVAERARRRLASEGRTPANGGPSAEEVFAAAREGEPWAQAVVAETVNYLALAIANISAMFDPELIILGGGVARSAGMLIEPIRERLQGVVPFVPALVPSQLGLQAAAMGAIMLVLNGTTENLVVKRVS